MSLNAFVQGDELLASELNTEFAKLDAGYITLTAGEDLTAGLPAWIYNGDSKVYTAHGYSESATGTTFSFPGTAINQVSKLNSTQFLLLGNSTNTLTVYVRATSAPNTNVASATVATDFDNGNGHTGEVRPSATVCRLTDSTFVVFWKNTSSGSLRFRTGSISGAVITMDTNTAYPSSPDYCYGLTAVPGASDGKVVLSYFDSGAHPGASSTTNVVNLSYLTVSTDSVTVTYNVNHSRTSGSYFSEGFWSQAVYTNGIAYGLFCSQDGSGVKYITYSYIDVSTGDTASNLDTLTLEIPTGAGTSNSYAALRPSFVGHNGKAYFGYTNGVLNTTAKYIWTVQEVSTGGVNIAWQHSVIGGGGTLGSYVIPMVGNECGVIVFQLPNQTTNTYSEIYIQRDRKYGISSVLTVTSNAPYPNYCASWYVGDIDEVVMFNTSASKSYTWQLPTPVDGVIQGSVSSGASCDIKRGNITGMSGLTANRKMYLKDSYSSAGDMATKGVIPIGLAVSSTHLLMDR